MEEITIYRFQLQNIAEALRVVANTYNCREGKTCLHRMVRDAEQYANNALQGKKDNIVRFGKTLKEE